MASWHKQRLRLPRRHPGDGRRAGNIAALLSLVGLIAAGLATYGHVTSSGGSPAFQAEPNLVEYSGLDSGSSVAWYIPPPASPSPFSSAPASSASAPASPSLPATGS
ncbi:MAG: hypothetical protein ACHQ01_03075 [Candidatus Limnocylindrales bacterium]